MTDMNAKRIRDSYNLKAFRQLGYRDVPERRNRTRMFVCAGCRLWIQQTSKLLESLMCDASEYLSQADTSCRPSKLCKRQFTASNHFLTETHLTCSKDFLPNRTRLPPAACFSTPCGCPPSSWSRSRYGPVQCQPYG